MTRHDEDGSDAAQALTLTLALSSVVAGKKRSVDTYIGPTAVLQRILAGDVVGFSEVKGLPGSCRICA